MTRVSQKQRSKLVREKLARRQKEKGRSCHWHIWRSEVFLCQGKRYSHLPLNSKIEMPTKILWFWKKSNKVWRITQQGLRCGFKNTWDKGQFGFKRVRTKWDPPARLCSELQIWSDMVDLRYAVNMIPIGAGEVLNLNEGMPTRSLSCRNQRVRLLAQCVHRWCAQSGNKKQCRDTRHL